MFGRHRHPPGMSLGPSNLDPDSLDLWIVSHGGVGSNALADFLAGQGVRTRPENYGLICHKQHPGTPQGVPALVLYGDYTDAIYSMARRNYLTANASKMCFGIGAPEISLRRFLSSFPEDPVGIKRLLESFKTARDSGLDQIEFLRYPFSNEEAEQVLSALGFDVRLDGFELRARKTGRRFLGGDVKRVVRVYENWVFSPDA